MALRATSDRLVWITPVLTAVVLTALAVGVSLGEEARNPQLRLLDPVGIALLLAGSMPVALSRRWPQAAYLVSMGSIGVYQALGYTINSPYFLGVLFTGYAAAAPGRRSRSAVLALLAFPIYAVGAVLRDRPDLAYGVPILTLAAVIAGQLASELRAASSRREARAQADEEARLLTEERLRIARELHDVISHSIATIGVQAGVAAHVLDEHPEQAREALVAIKAVSRDAMRDLRGMLGLLRQSDETDGRDPAPGLERLRELVERVRGAGVAVGVETHGSAYPLTPATDLAAYRIVQEALTNIIRHAPEASAQVYLRYGPEVVEIEVIDNGRAPGDNGTAATSPGTGHGLTGLRERAAALGGTLEYGQIENGGFRVSACLPTGISALSAS
jgi:signal transduction histidine kinase